MMNSKNKMILTKNQIELERKYEITYKREIFYILKSKLSIKIKSFNYKLYHNALNIPRDAECPWCKHTINQEHIVHNGCNNIQEIKLQAKEYLKNAKNQEFIANWIVWKTILKIHFKEFGNNDLMKIENYVRICYRKESVIHQ